MRNGVSVPRECYNIENNTAGSKTEKPETSLLAQGPTGFLKPTTTGRPFHPQVPLKMQAAARSLWPARVWHLGSSLGGSWHWLLRLLPQIHDPDGIFLLGKPEGRVDRL